MVKVRVMRGSIPLESLTGDAALARRVGGASTGGNVLLDVGGYVGCWVRTTDGIAPVDGNVRDAWEAMRVDDLVEVRLVAAEGNGLVTFGFRGQMWDPPEARYR